MLPDLSVSQFSGLPPTGSDSAKFGAVSSVVTVVGGADVLSTTSLAVLDEHLVDAVLDLVTTLAQPQVHVCQRLVLLDGVLQLSAAFLHTDRHQYSCPLPLVHPQS